jgi:hypothetical protein
VADKSAVAETGAAAAVPVASQDFTILWLDHAGRTIGRTWTTLKAQGTVTREQKRRVHRMAIRQACAWLEAPASNYGIPRAMGCVAPEGSSTAFTISMDELHLVSGFRLVEGHV